jgi:hypothetical protein
MTRQFAALLLVAAGACSATGGDGEDLGLQNATASSMPAPKEAGGQLRLTQTNLTSDQPGVAANTDPNLVNAWGLAVSPTAPKPAFCSA